MTEYVSRDDVLVSVGVEVVTGIVDLHPLPALYDVLVVGRLLEKFLNDLLRQTKLRSLGFQLENVCQSPAQKKLIFLLHRDFHFV